MATSGVKVITKVVLDVFLFLLVLIPVVLLQLIGVPFQRGFNCGDQTIVYEYGKSTVNKAVLLGFTLLIPILFISISEYFNIERLQQALIKKEKLTKYAWSLYRFIGIFLLGFIVTLLIALICKVLLGNLRPYFLDVCDPDMSKIECTRNNRYIAEDVCRPKTEEEEEMLVDARMSFMSAHASQAAFAMFYLIFYMQYRFCFKIALLLKPFLQLILFVLALLTGLSRIFDYKHHWEDVFFGFVTGVFVAFFFAFWVAHIRGSAVPCLNTDEIKHRDEMMLERLNKHHEFHRHERT